MHKLKSKGIKNLNIKSTTMNLIEERVASTLEHIGTGDHFLNTTPITQTLRETINKMDLLKLRSFGRAKGMVNKTKQQHTEWVKILINHISDRGLISKIYKEIKKLVIKRTNNPKKMRYRPKQKTLNRGI